MKKLQAFLRKNIFLILSSLLGLVPALLMIHVLADDFEGYLRITDALLLHGSYGFAEIKNYCDSPILTGITSRTPLLSFLLLLSISLFGRRLLFLYLPIFIFRIFITPVTYLIGCSFFKKEAAFLVSSLTVFLLFFQTFTVSNLEADTVMIVLMLIFLYFFSKNEKKPSGQNLILLGVFLGLMVLAKETGLPLAVGFLLATFLKDMVKKKSFSFAKYFKITIPFLLLVIPFFLFSFLKTGRLFLHHFSADRSISYLPLNLKNHLVTFFTLLGVDFSLGIKASIISGFIGFFYLLGLFYLIRKKYFELWLPFFFVFIVFSLILPCVTHGDGPNNVELIRHISFYMPIAILTLACGVKSFLRSLGKRLNFSCKKNTVLFFAFFLLINFKFVRNHFSATYALDVDRDFYVNIFSLIKDKRELPYISYEKKGGLYFVSKNPLHKLVRRDFRKYKISAFSVPYRYLTVGIWLTGVILGLILILLFW